QRIWSQDPPYQLKGEFWNIEIKDGILPALGVGFMPKPYQPGGPPISVSLASPSSASARTAARKGWGMISANLIPPYAVESHWQVYREACREAGIAPRGEQWRVAHNVLVAPTDAAAEERVFGEQGSNHYFYAYLREVLSAVGLLSILKPRPDMPDA